MSEFRLKILVGGNVILVECSGYEPEMFVPTIVNSRITLQNVIEQRRCCKPNSNTTLKSVENNAEIKKRSSGVSVRQLSPLANSTPERKSQSFKENHSLIRSYPTPDVVRRAVQNKNVSVSIPSLVPRLKDVLPQKVSTRNTPNNLAKIAPLPKTQSPLAITPVRSQPLILRRLSNVSSFGTPPSLQITGNTGAQRSPNQSFLVRKIKTTPCSATKWRKCITPQRTYIRRSNGQKIPIKLKKLSVKPIQLNKQGNIVPDFLLNPTKNPSGDGRILVRRRKLVIDTDIRITPRTFKKQLHYTEDLKRSNFQLPKVRRHFISSQQTAFDLLTNSGYYPCIAKELNAVFRQGCLNKHAETIMKYQQLTMDIPKMENV